VWEYSRFPAVPPVAAAAAIVIEMDLRMALIVKHT
jgi:hypothetical protein